MKYILPENLKTYPFPCDDCKDCVTYTRCKKHCPETYRSCWESNLCKDLQLDCDVENEQHFGKYVVCHKCGSGDVIGCGFNRFMCADCGATMSYDQSDYKEIMGDEYLEIDEKELSEKLKAIK